MQGTKVVATYSIPRNTLAEKEILCFSLTTPDGSPRERKKDFVVEKIVGLSDCPTVPRCLVLFYTNSTMNTMYALSRIQVCDHNNQVCDHNNTKTYQT